jgi:hypothetical protein
MCSLPKRAWRFENCQPKRDQRFENCQPKRD